MKKLTNREKEILKLLVEGTTNKEIADRLSISYHTVKTNIEKIYDDIEIHNRVLAAIYIKNNPDLLQ